MRTMLNDVDKGLAHRRRQKYLDGWPVNLYRLILRHFSAKAVPTVATFLGHGPHLVAAFLGRVRTMSAQRCRETSVE